MSRAGEEEVGTLVPGPPITALGLSSYHRARGLPSYHSDRLALLSLRSATAGLTVRHPSCEFPARQCASAATTNQSCTLSLPTPVAHFPNQSHTSRTSHTLPEPAALYPRRAYCACGAVELAIW